MYLPLTLIPLSTVSWTTALPVPDNGQAAVALPTTSPTPTTVTVSFEKRQHAYAPVATYEPILDVLAGNAADALKERASGAGTSFDSLLCATLKALKGENPATFTSLLQSCTSLIDSSSHGRVKALKNRNDVAIDVEAVDSGSGKAILGRSKTALPEKRGVDINTIMEKRREGDFDSLRAPL